MGLANVVYTVLGALAAIGMIGLLASRIGKRPRLARPMFVLLAVSALGLLFWPTFLNVLRDSVTENIMEGQFAQENMRQEALLAQYRGLPGPKPTESDLRAVAAMEAAKRNAQQFGWDWEELIASRTEEDEED